MLLRCFLKREDTDEAAAADEDEEDDGDDGDDLWSHGVKSCWLVPQRIIACSTPPGEPAQYLVKWEDLGYEQVTWELESDIAQYRYLIDEYHQREASTLGWPTSAHTERERERERESEREE